VVRLDAGVDDRHVHVDPLVDTIDLGDGVALGEDPRDAGWRRLALDLNDLVGNDGDDARIGLECLALLRVKSGAEAADRLAERAIGLDPLLAAHPLDGRARVGPRVEQDDVAAGHVGAAV
jgi:hypothetical protein